MQYDRIVQSGVQQNPRMSIDLGPKQESDGVFIKGERRWLLIHYLKR